MKPRYIIYAALIGLLFRQIEVLLIGLKLGWFMFWHPAIWLGYALAAIILYLFFWVVLYFSARKRSMYFRREVALCFTFLIFVWVSISANVKCGFLYDAEVILTSDWARNFGISLVIFSIPAIIIALIIYQTQSSRDYKKVYTFNLSKRAKTGIVLLIVVMVIESILVTFFLPSLAGEENKKDYNVILISVDTLRKDHLSLYGYKRQTSPNLDRYFSQAVRFERCIATCPETGPSYTSIYTGTYPFSHKVFNNTCTFEQGAMSIKTMAQELGQNGYYCSSHLTGSLSGTQCNLDVGIDELYQRGVKVVSSSGYDLYSIVGNMFAYFISINDRKSMNRRLGPETVKAVKWFDSKPPEPFYTHVFWHWPHNPYGDRKVDVSDDFLGQTEDHEPLPPISRTQIDSIRHQRQLYDSDIYYTDIQIGAVMDALKRNGYLDNSIVIFTADHGEDMGERLRGEEPFFGHSYWLYESSVAVPLLILLPGKELSGQKVQFPVSSTDIFPSILSLLDLPLPKTIQGQSFFEGSMLDLSIRQKLASLRPYVYSFNYFNEKSTFAQKDFSAVISERYTWHRTESTKDIELYDIISDRHSTHNISLDRQALAKAYQKDLDSWLDQHNYSHLKAREHNKANPSATDRAMEELRSLGYVK